MKDQAVVTLSETLGIDPVFGNSSLDTMQRSQDVIGAPVFGADQCLAPFSLHYEHLNQNLAISGIIYIDDDQSAMIGTLDMFIHSRKIACAKAVGTGRDRYRDVGNR